MKNKTLSFNYELNLYKNFDVVFGIDEVGRGSFAGPLVASCVYFEKEHKWFKEINDSKLLTAKKREELAKLILENSVYFIEEIEVELINKIGIGRANKLIFENLITKIKNRFKDKNVYFLIDGNNFDFEIKNIEYIIKGDSKHISIAAASIIAKVHRDKLMTKLDIKYPGYYFLLNKGYGTKMHRESLKKHGLSSIHRTSFNLDKYL
ncbi:MAG: ribonuclease HII [Patescibacteria group bacterium]